MKELEDHHDLAELEFKSLHDDAELARSEPDAYTVISFDLHQNLPTPHKRVLYFIYDSCGFTILEFIMLAMVMDICVCGLAMVMDIVYVAREYYKLRVWWNCIYSVVES